ncbi:biopolymer transporter ExbD [Planctomycetota bacterium]
MQTTRENIQQALFKRLATNRRRTFALRMTPMIDLIFLLLIFFLVVSKWRPPENFLPMQLPAAEAHQESFGRPEPLIMRISDTKAGCLVKVGSETVRINNESIESDLAQLLEKIKNHLLAQKRFVTDPVEIICAPQAKWDHLAKIYNILIGAGLRDITFEMTEQGGNGSVN